MIRQNRKPVSVLICHLSSQPTPWKRAGSPFILSDIPVYLALLDLVPSPPYVAIRRRELLPRGFTLTLSGGLFSATASIRLLPSVLSTAGCPAQSGLSSEAAASKDAYYPRRRWRQPQGARVTILKRSRISDRSVLPDISMNYLYPSFRSILSFCIFILSTSFTSAGVISSQCLWHCIDFEYILPMQKLLCVHPLQ